MAVIKYPILRALLPVTIGKAMAENKTTPIMTITPVRNIVAVIPLILVVPVLILQSPLHVLMVYVFPSIVSTYIPLW